ncbi:hypothetical protein GCK32_008311 [Trichostrongylus colubriformis]|uniref:Rab-GAP TBC domain-containing protein n=1 Tax=Trichostrongylus colubriformis TaxID=6319 RepID=A0AAN8FDG8_TRICO
MPPVGFQQALAAAAMGATHRVPEATSSSSHSERHEQPSRQSRVQDGAPMNQVMRELTANGERLHPVDPVLAAHLNSLDIPKQLYESILCIYVALFSRWLRLLFGREFSIHDLLYVWDVLLCDRPIERVVECIFLACKFGICEGFIEGDEGEHTYTISQKEIVDAVDIASASKASPYLSTCILIAYRSHSNDTSNFILKTLSASSMASEHDQELNLADVGSWLKKNW